MRKLFILAVLAATPLFAQTRPAATAPATKETVASATQPAETPVAPNFLAALKAGKKQTVVFYGTSLTAAGAWANQVQETIEKQFPDQVTFINSAKSGQTSVWGAKYVRPGVAEKKPDLVLIEFAINDATARFNITKEASRKNWETMIKEIRDAQPNCEIILQVMNPVVGKQKDDKSYREDLPGYEQVVRDVAKEKGVALIDHAPAWSKLLAEGEPAYLKAVTDGVHPSAKAYEKHVTPTILKALGIENNPSAK